MKSFKEFLKESSNKSKDPDSKFGLTKVMVVTKNGTYKFKNFKEAKKKFPTLDLNNNTKDFTWGMDDDGDYIRFEDWYTYKMMSN